MGRKTLVASWLCMALAFEYLYLANAASPSAANQRIKQNDTKPQDAEMSGSERNRRLIPYMTFYLPPTEIPINQQYAIQQQRYSSTNSSDDRQMPATAIESAGPLPPPGYIAVPTAFLRMKATVAPQYENTNQPRQQQPLNQPQYKIANNENRYLLPITVKIPVTVGQQQPLLHLLPPGTSGNELIGVPVLRPNKQKATSIQHFPPLEESQRMRQQQQQEQQHDQLQTEPIYYQTRYQASQQEQRKLPPKINFTPFTSSNTVPGDFVPIIYTSVNIVESNAPNDQRLTKPNNNNGDRPVEQTPQYQEQAYYQTYDQYKQPKQNDYIETTNYEAQSQQQQQQQQQQAQHEQRHQQQLQQEQYQQQQEQQRHQQPHIQFIEIDGVDGPQPISNPKASTQAGPAYHIIKESSRPNELTPQEKYVLYLRQRMRYNSKQQQQQQQKYVHSPKQYGTSEYTPSTHSENSRFVYSTTATPARSPTPIMMSTAHENNQNYPQHSPIRHAVYLRPELPIPPNHQATTKPLQQVLHIPVQSLLSEIDSFQKTLQPGAPNNQIEHQHLQQQQKHHQHHHHHQKFQHHKQQQQQFIQRQPLTSAHLQSKPLPLQYADNSLDEPRKYAVDNLTPYHSVSSTASPPQPPAAFIFVTTSAPPHQLVATPNVKPQQQDYQMSTLRPNYHQSSPTLRLRPISTAMGSKYAQAHGTPTPTPTIFVSTTPRYNHVMTSATTALRLQPTINFPSPTPTSAYKRPIPKNYFTPQQSDEGERYHKLQHKQQQHHQHQQLTSLDDPNQLPDIRTSSLAEILHKLQASNHLPQTLTPDNIDNSIKTLITILNNLKQTQSIVPNPPQHHEPPAATQDYDYHNGNDDDQSNNDDISKQPNDAGPNKHPGPSTGRAGIDYPNYAEIPQTSFDCSQQRYKGFFGDPETSCQVWHYCDLNGGKASFLCPNGTIFSQIALTCDWWFNVKCSTTPQLYVLNERLYKYILPFNPKFPEDYSGPIVDKYLAMKFKEMEEKMRLEKEKKQESGNDKKIENMVVVTVTTTAAAKAADKPTERNQLQQINEQSSEKNLLTDDIADDIAQRGSFDTYEANTSAKPTMKTKISTEPYSENDEGEIEPLSVRPIVVPSTTVEPNQSNEVISTEYEQNYLETKEGTNFSRQRSPKQKESSAEVVEAKSSDLSTHSRGESTKISIEKVDVIEIKNDGHSGHLTREMFYRNL